MADKPELEIVSAETAMKELAETKSGLFNKIVILTAPCDDDGGEHRLEMHEGKICCSCYLRYLGITANV